MKTPRILIKDIHDIFKLWIYTIRIFFNAPFIFSNKNRIEISKPWLLASSTAIITALITTNYINMFKLYPENIQNPFQLLGYGRKFLTTILITIRMMGTLKNTKPMAEILNTFLKINILLPLSKKKRITSYLFVICEVVALIFVISVRSLPIIKWQPEYGVQYLINSIFTTVTDVSLIILDVTIIKIMTLLGFYFENFQFEVKNLEKENEKLFFHIFEISCSRNK